MPLHQLRTNIAFRGHDGYNIATKTPIYGIVARAKGSKDWIAVVDMFSRPRRFASAAERDAYLVQMRVTEIERRRIAVERAKAMGLNS